VPEDIYGGSYEFAIRGVAKGKHNDKVKRVFENAVRELRKLEVPEGAPEVYGVGFSNHSVGISADAPEHEPGIELLSSEVV